jgi:hypothetical protein
MSSLMRLLALGGQSLSSAGAVGCESLRAPTIERL